MNKHDLADITREADESIDRTALLEALDADERAMRRVDRTILMAAILSFALALLVIHVGGQ